MNQRDQKLYKIFYVKDEKWNVCEGSTCIAKLILNMDELSCAILYDYTGREYNKKSKDVDKLTEMFSRIRNKLASSPYFPNQLHGCTICGITIRGCING